MKITNTLLNVYIYLLEIIIDIARLNFSQIFMILIVIIFTYLFSIFIMLIVNWVWLF